MNDVDLILLLPVLVHTLHSDEQEKGVELITKRLPSGIIIDVPETFTEQIFNTLEEWIWNNEIG